MTKFLLIFLLLIPKLASAQCVADPCSSSSSANLDVQNYAVISGLDNINLMLISGIDGAPLASYQGSDIFHVESNHTVNINVSANSLLHDSCIRGSGCDTSPSDQSNPNVIENVLLRIDGLSTVTTAHSCTSMSPTPTPVGCLQTPHDADHTLSITAQLGSRVGDQKSGHYSSTVTVVVSSSP